MSAGGRREGRVHREFERHRQALIADLIAQFGVLDLGTVGRTAIAVEDFLFEAIKQLICAEAQPLFRANKADKAARLFVCGADEYQIKVTGALLKPDQLLVAVMPHELGVLVDEHDLDAHDVTIEGYGRYQRVTALAPRSLRTDWALFEYIIKSTLETVYAWFHQQILALIASENQAVATELYSYARTIFLRNDVWRKLWFGAMSDGRGFRLFEGFVVESAFDTAREHSAEFGRGANDVVAEILNTNLPIEHLLMRNVIARKEPIDVDISKAAYHKQQSTYSEAMRSFYGSTAFAIYPILTDVEWPDKVIALYPTALRSEIDPVLHAHRGALREIAKKSQNKIRDTLKAMKLRTKSLDGQFANLRLHESNSVVVWNGKSYAVSPLQFGCVRVLYNLAIDGTELVHQKNILSSLTTDSHRLRDIFKGHVLFKTLIKPRGRGYFSLEIDPPDEPTH